MVSRFAQSEPAFDATVATIRSNNGIANRHTEPDHVAGERLAGLRAAELRESTGATVMAGAGDAAVIRGEAGDQIRRWLSH
jgi:hypothetical protein